MTDKSNKTYEITYILLFEGHDGKDGDDFSANLTINDAFMLQRGTDGEYSIPFARQSCWSDEKRQDEAHETILPDELAMSVDADAAIAFAKKHPINWMFKS